MKLMTKVIEKKAQKQYILCDSMEQMVVAKFFDPCGSWSWYLLNSDPTDTDYMWGIVKGNEIEIGSFSFSDLQKYKGPMGIGIERDKFFKPMKARELFEKLKNGEHI